MLGVIQLRLDKLNNLQHNFVKWSGVELWCGVEQLLDRVCEGFLGEQCVSV